MVEQAFFQTFNHYDDLMFEATLLGTPGASFHFLDTVLFKF